MNAGINLLLSLLFTAGVVTAGGDKHHGGGGGGGHHSAEHVAAVKKCSDDYKAALKEAKGKKGKEREDATRQAKEERKQCIANAPI
jgi:hypothetical protein